MFLTYLFCLLSGGVLIALSLAGDSNSDGFEGDGEGGTLSVLFSTSFWSFSLSGFGLCGVLLTLIGRDGSASASLALSALTGIGMGLAAAKTLQLLGRRTADSSIRSADLSGQSGVVTLRVEPDQRGFVEINIRGSLIRRPAISTGQSLAKGTRIVVLQADHHTLEVEEV